ASTASSHNTPPMSRPSCARQWEFVSADAAGSSAPPRWRGSPAVALAGLAALPALAVLPGLACAPSPRSVLSENVMRRLWRKVLAAPPCAACEASGQTLLDEHRAVLLGLDDAALFQVLHH